MAWNINSAGTAADMIAAVTAMQVTGPPEATAQLTRAKRYMATEINNVGTPYVALKCNGTYDINGSVTQVIVQPARLNRDGQIVVG